MPSYLKLTIWVCLLSILSGTVEKSSKNDLTDVDILIKNGKVIDGTGNPWFYADIGISDDRIVWVGKSDDVSGNEVIDASGLYITPGFIDVHSHAGQGLSSESLSHGRPLLAQGVTTVMINPDGGGSIDIAGQKVALKEHGLGVNVTQLVPHGVVRRYVMGEEDRAPTRSELEQMKSIVEDGMKNGAFGLSTGLFYSPGAFAETDEIIELAKVVSKYNGVYSSHIRDESDYNVGLIYSVDEVIRIAEEAKLPGIVSHIKALGTGVWGYSSAVVNRVERARNQGVEVYADQYPYLASSTSLSAALIPAWVIEGGRSEMLKRLNDLELIDVIKSEMESNLDRRGGAENILISEYSINEEYEGKRLSELAKILDKDPIEVALVLIKNETPMVVSFNMNKNDVELFMKQPWVMTSSDGGLVEMGTGVVHPRNYGSFSRKISTYVKENRTIELEFAIRSMTSLPASVFNLHNRGVIMNGQIADITIFDLDRVRDKATFDDPHQLSEGVEYVIIGGKFALKKGEVQEQTVGRVLKNHERN